MNIFIGVLTESFNLLNRMSPYLLFGFLFAGILHILFSPEKIARHLGGQNLGAVIKASLVGVPLPLCSCGVIPMALSLRKEGASIGAVLSFLVSTPTTGIDSIFATYSLLGPFFALYRVAASFIAGLFTGVMANIFAREPQKAQPAKDDSECKLCHEENKHSHTAVDKFKGIFTYAFGELLQDVGKWLILGVIIGGAITYFMPEAFIERYLGSGWIAILLMLAMGIPMYVCATGSIPIAAALMLKGLNPGAAFVFLLAGPATNTVTITVVAKYIGKKAVAVYLFSIALMAVLLGILLDKIWGIFFKAGFKDSVMHAQMLPDSFGIVSSAVLLSLIVLQEIKRRRQKA